MKENWFTPITLVPASGYLLKGILTGIHLLVALALYGLVALPLFVAVAPLLLVHWQRLQTDIVGRREVMQLSIRRSGRIALIDHGHRNRIADLHAFKLIPGLLLIRVTHSERVFSLCFRSGQQDPDQWHRVKLMNRYMK